MRSFFLLCVLLFAASALAIPPSLAQYTTTQAGTPGIFWTDTREGYSSYYLDNANEVPATYYDLIIYNCESFPVHNESQVWYINPPEWDRNDISRITNRVEILGLEGCMAQTVACEPTVLGEETAPGMVACEQTLADIRDRLTAPDDFTPPARTNPTSKTAAAFGSFIADSKALFVWSDIDINSKFPFGYAERLSNVDISATGCPSSGGAGLASAFNYCGSGVHSWLAPKVKAAMTFIAWLAFAVGVNATWAQAMA